MNKKIIMGGLGLLILAGLYFGFQWLCVDCFKIEYFTSENIRNFIAGFGPWAVVIYIFLYTVNTITLLPPIAIMSLSAGVLFGPLWGGFAIMAGALTGTTVTFFIARFLGKDFVSKFVKGEKAEAFQQKLNENGFFVILPMRLIGFPPYEVINYASGLSTIKYRDYIIATAIGFLPASFAQSFVSAKVSTFNFKDPALYIAVVAFLLVIFVPTYFLKNKKAKKLVGKDEVNE